MSTHISRYANQSLVATLPKFRNIEAFKQWVVPHFKEVDTHFVTLTFNPNVKFEEVASSAKVSLFLKRLNRRVFGKAYDKGYCGLKSLPVFELNHADGLHVHMLLERPATIKNSTKNFEDLIKEIWCEINYEVIKGAQDIRPCSNLDKLLSYMTKQTRFNDNMRLDFNNFNWIATTA